MRRRDSALGRVGSGAPIDWPRALAAHGVRAGQFRHHRAAQQHRIRRSLLRLLEARRHAAARVVAPAQGGTRRHRRTGRSPIVIAGPEIAVDRAHADIEALLAASADDSPLPDRTAPSWKAPTSGGSTGRPKLIVSGSPGVLNPLQIAYWKLGRMMWH
ncbi:MAG: hypothetical protein WDN69_31680 [Aliidongia sp.]